jgi:hypothetical protein
VRRLPRFHAELDFGKLSDEDRHELAAGVALVAPSSPIFVDNDSVQASVAALGKKAGKLKERNGAVDNDRAQLRVDLAEEAVARAALDGELRTLLTLVEVHAQSPAEIQGMAFKPRGHHALEAAAPASRGDRRPHPQAGAQKGHRVRPPERRQAASLRGRVVPLRSGHVDEAHRHW